MMKVLQILLVFILSVFSLTAQETLMLKADHGYGGCEANAIAFLGQRGHNCQFLSSFP